MSPKVPSGNGAGPETGVGGEPLRLGGMALRNGLLIHGPTSWAAAVRNAAGEIEVASGPKPVIAPTLAARVPLLRGPLRLIEAFALLPAVRLRLRSARMPLEAPGVIAAMLASATAGRVLRERLDPTARRELAAAAIGLVPALVALGDRNLAAYHGVEHKAIGAYEQGSMDPKTATREHDRCGSNLVAPLIVLSAGGQLALERLVERPGAIAKGAVGVASVAIAAELFAWSERNAEAPLARAFHRPGHEIQRLVATKEPSEEQIEVGTAALEEILRAEASAA